MSPYWPTVSIAASSAPPRHAHRRARLGRDQRVVHRRHVQRGQQPGRVPAQDVGQLRIVAAARAALDQRDGAVGAQQPVRRLGVGRQLHDPHDALDRLALEALGTPLPVPALEHLGHRRRDTRRQPQPFGEQPPDLAVRARWHARSLAERAQQLADPTRKRVVAPDVRDDRAQELGRRSSRHVRDPPARVLAQHADAEVVVAGATDGLQQSDVERVARLVLVEARGLRQRDGQQRRPLAVLEGDAEPDVGRQR
jgi:hypothetical protein